MAPRWPTRTVADFEIGQQVWVHADQSFRRGVVTKLGRTRVSVSHPRNQRGTMVERAYPMDRIVIGQGECPTGWGWGWVTASGHWYELGHNRRRHPNLPVVESVS